MASLFKDRWDTDLAVLPIRCHPFDFLAWK